MIQDYSDYHRDEDYRKFESMFRNIFAKRLLLIHRCISSKGRVLDIGCANGIFLDLFKENGWKTWGIEPSGTAKIAKDKGHRIIRDYFGKVNLPEDYFDLVILNHTLEHMDDPALVLKKIYKIMKSGGTLFVDVPNVGSLGSKLLGKYWPYRLPNEHKWQFTKQGLSKLIDKAGFKVVLFESRSGIFEYANPFLELWQSLSAFKKRFFTDLLTLPYALCTTLLKMGDSMSMIGKKI